MKSVLIYAGTTEGRRLSEMLAQREIPSLVCVATEYGEQVMHETLESRLIRVRQGRLTKEQMKQLYAGEDFLAVVDATHPYATLVTENVRESLSGSCIPYFRISRALEEEQETKEGCLYFSSAAECAEALGKTEGTVLLTTGSKELEAFCGEESLRKRLAVRVLPGRESLEACYQNGLEGRQIIAMQGPFTKEMNLATIRQWGAASLVTKESGKTGGADEKMEAAREAGIPCYVIRRPVAGQEEGHTFEEVLKAVVSLAQAEEEAGRAAREQAGRTAEGKAPELQTCKETGRGCLDVVLAGIGMGAPEDHTAALDQRLAETDYLFGAKRMLEGLTAKKEKVPHYLAKDILPYLEKLPDDAKITILFSGDAGFFSGAEKMRKALEGLKRARIRILPGISSICALSARLGISWQDADIISAHGTETDAWKTSLLFSLRRGRKVFFLTSGPEDVREVGEILTGQGLADCFEIKLGRQLSYDDEEILEVTAKAATEITKPGLYAGFLIPKATGIATGQITPGVLDEEFLREKVPMTKEEVREVSICKLHLTENAVVYDVGSGTGSISMEIAALSPKVRVYALECKPEAVALTKKNQEKFGAFNIRVVEGTAPESFEGLPAPSHVFIGGSGGKLEEILDALYHKNPRARVVMNAISLESIAQMQGLLKKYPVRDVDVTTVSVSKAREIGSYHLMQAANPVTIFSFTFYEAEGGEA